MDVNAHFQASVKQTDAQPQTVLLSNALIPLADGGYQRADVLLQDGVIKKLAESNTLKAKEGVQTLDCTERMLLPGFVNAHTHSVQQWTRGLIKPLPLELWVMQNIRHEPRGACGWHGSSSFSETPSAVLGLSALHCGLESLLSGCTTVLDHIMIRNLDDLAAVAQAYKALGVRAFLAPMLNDDAVMYQNYIPLVNDGEARNAHARNTGCACCGMGPEGAFRTQPGASDAKKTAAMLALWEAAVERFHDPANGIEIVIGPATAYSASEALLRGAAALRRKYNLCGHTHLLETRAQALMAKQFLPSGSAVRHLHETGFLQGRGTSCAHTIWLEDDEMALMAEAGASCVHNPLSNLRLGSGVMPLDKLLDKGVNVAMGCDGAASGDGQDILEAIKLATTLPCVLSAEYRRWPAARRAALTLAAKNGYQAVGMGGQAGEIVEGACADLTLWDLTALSLLPRTDPLSLLVLGSRTQAAGAGSALHSCWVRGRQVVADGSPCGVDVRQLRVALRALQPEFRDPSITDPATDASTAASEVEYRAAMGLDLEGKQEPTPHALKTYPKYRVLYDETLP
uniref:Amidohydrolase-related domain-containing protein n=1 Tax=Chrysotila carterae TaxID=13221 RepID=A0A7S4ET46_CHRCT|mmetsp:Transcript_11191/g.24039  ORF Transcript_11191/g.24039 Transcript_11191/m.24039 type:complete len:570 (+) Transcript_11191:209-1918(+)